MPPRRANRSDDVLVVVDRRRLVFCRRDRGVMNQRSLRWNQRERRFGFGSLSYFSTRAGGSLWRKASFPSGAKDAGSISGRHGRAQILQRLRTALSPMSASPSLPILVSLTLACVQSVSTSRACVISWYISPYSCRTVAE